jgi:hypothetical protein
VSDLLKVLNQLTGGDDGEPLRLRPLRTSRTVLTVGGSILPSETVDEHYRRCVQLAHDAVKALRLATDARIPNLTISRAWPVYFIVVENEPGNVKVHNQMMVAHGFSFSDTVPASADQLRDAALILRVGWSGSPVETYRDFELGAQNAAWVDGDYTDAVLKAAVAAEVLLKHTAWMLTWEVSEEEKANTSSTAATFDPFKAKPGRLIGNVLARRLGGDWSSRDEAKPIGAWRSHIARRRNAVIHTGFARTRPRSSRPWKHSIGSNSMFSIAWPSGLPSTLRRPSFWSGDRASNAGAPGRRFTRLQRTIATRKL